ncbi:uncharacterized protein LOC143544101 [Bidens hawaiensis]|uniref:uncharacterized protein LOC143544101 n=1 Tax=Bidens hawaiensis TaxID=980011 RepID=UPI00404B8AB5
MDFVRLFNDFYEGIQLNQSCMSSFIALIPKIKDPLHPKDFRPISLIGCINKVISKVLVNRLKPVIGSLISEEQSAFLHGRNIADGPLMLNEFVVWMKSNHKMGMLFKVDINKAYDSLNWAFLDSIMAQMKFPGRWRYWILAILRAGRASVLINGSPTMEFACNRGLRQGDPLSPFLFVIAMEALTGIMKKSTNIGLFHDLKCTLNGPAISHLLYADDVVFLGEWSVTNAMNLQRILRCFHLASGLKANLEKCSVYGVGVGESEIENMASILHCKPGKFPFRYLGLQVGANMNLIRSWIPIIELVKKRLSIWKARSLSYGGRVTLIKSVLNSLPTYYFSLYKAPNQVIDELEKLRRIFFWGGTEDESKINWIAWKKVVEPIDRGGLGFGSLREANLSMLSKWWWRFKTEKHSLWRKVIWAIHHNSRSWIFIPARLSLSGPWKQIHNVSEQLSKWGVELHKVIKPILGDGSSIMFWIDAWFEDSPLRDRFPELFALEKHKRCWVSDRLKLFGDLLVFCWQWSRVELSDTELQRVQDMENYLGTVASLEGNDSWSWKPDQSGEFSVSSIKRCIRESQGLQSFSSFQWNNWVPMKVGIIAWRAAQERLPTLMALAARNIHLESTRCPLCGDYDETSDHLFVSCQSSQVIWQVIAQWCKVPTLYAFSIKDLLDFHLTIQGTEKRRKVIHAMVLITIWSIWKLRNDRVFNQAETLHSKTIEEIKSLGYLWVRCRSKESDITWNSWRRRDEEDGVHDGRCNHWTVTVKAYGIDGEETRVAIIKHDILSRFIEFGKDPENNINDKCLREVVLNFVIAGRDTTSTTLSWAIYMIMTHIHVAGKLYEELKSFEQDRSEEANVCLQPCETQDPESFDQRTKQFAELMSYDTLERVDWL